MAELIRGKSGRVIGSLVALLTVMKSLPLAYNKDMQEDKEAAFSAVDTAKSCLKVITPMIAGLKVNRDNMRKAAAKGFINATDCADYLANKGMPFRDAYKITGEIVRECMEKYTVLEEFPLYEYQKYSELFDPGIYEAVSLENCLLRRVSKGGPSPAEVLNQIEILKKKLNELGV